MSSKFKIVAVISITLSILSFGKMVYALDILPSGIPQPGVTCGDPNGSGDLQKCCKSAIVKPPPVELQAPGLSTLLGIIQPIIEKNTNAIIQQQKSIIVKPCVNEGIPSTPGDTNNNNCICLSNAPKESLAALSPVCNNIKDNAEQNACRQCADQSAGAWTALGCFNGNLSEFISQKILGTGIGLAGGISMLCIMFAAFQMQTSRGNAEKVKKAQELMTNCITGLMIIIFSILILKIIGVDILRIPGFGS